MERQIYQKNYLVKEKMEKASTEQPSCLDFQNLYKTYL